MSSDWPEVRIEEIAASGSNALSTGPFGSAIGAKFFTESGVPVIRGSNLSADVGVKLVDENLVFVSFDKAKEFSRSVAKRGDLVFTCWGTINQVGLIHERSKYPEYVVSNKQMKLTVDPKKVDSKFLYYVFSGPEKQQELLANAIGAAVPGFNLGQLKKHAFRLPPLDVQQRIVRVLDSLDTRIDVNRRINQTLEAMAHAIFKSWFVDFDPVKAKIAAKQEGRDPLRAAMCAISGKADAELDALPPEQYEQLAATAALFPDDLEESELGEIPKGWTVQRLGNVLELVYGKALKSADRQDGHVPVYGSGGITGYHNKPLVPRGSVIVGRKGTVGSLYWEDNPFFPIDTTYYVCPLAAPLTFCYYAMQTLGLEKMNTDAAVPGLNRENAYRLELILPDSDTLKLFDLEATTLRKAIRSNSAVIKALADLRDTLLPKLLSGELSVKEAAVEAEA
ncbi:restriction endonuclease subunit S [Aquabacterium sp.]|uniref:restriction endonuclease subunit S n=1 Tax=Aquabacterium sp. TaxID=1872578 RepID=UPI002E302720|nr:restriction endonuclease subunit S [Aquabacterium sp.]HEX5311121.1 restriction endonuclease subunit S [Aquabacterium sp.]